MGIPFQIPETYSMEKYEVFLSQVIKNDLGLEIRVKEVTDSCTTYVKPAY